MRVATTPIVIEPLVGRSIGAPPDAADRHATFDRLGGSPLAITTLAATDDRSDQCGEAVTTMLEASGEGFAAAGGVIGAAFSVSHLFKARENDDPAATWASVFEIGAGCIGAGIGVGLFAGHPIAQGVGEGLKIALSTAKQQVLADRYLPAFTSHPVTLQPASRAGKIGR